MLSRYSSSPRRLERRSSRRHATVMTDLLVGISKPYQLPFSPGPSEKLKTNRQIFVDETHRNNDDRPLRGRTDERELALWRLAAITVDLRWKCPDGKDKSIDMRGLHRSSEGVAIHLLVLAAFDRGGIFLRRFVMAAISATRATC